MLSDRPAAAVATIAIHAGAIALLLSSTTATPQQVARNLSVFDISAAAAMPQAAPEAPPSVPVKKPPPQPVIAPPAVVPTTNDIVVATLDQTPPGITGGVCDLTAVVQSALQSSDAVQNTLPQIPRDQRSVANAVMIWKAAWLTDARDPDATAMTVIRDVVARTVTAATPECRLQPQAGPRLLIVQGAAENVVLAVGSGAWRWQDLVDTAAADPEVAAPPKFF